MVYTSAQPAVLYPSVPVSAHLPMVYTDDGMAMDIHVVPVSAHLPMVYTWILWRHKPCTVPVSAHLPMVYTATYVSGFKLMFRLVPISRWCILRRLWL